MKITMGGKKLTANMLLEEGLYDGGEIVGITEGEKTTIGSELLDTLEFTIKIDYDGQIQEKKKKMILTDRPGSELADLLKEFKHLQDDDGSIDLMDLKGQKCMVEIVHNMSKNGNIFANVGEITSVAEEDDINE